MKLEVDKFYSWSSFVTVAGMASMLWVVAGTLSKAFEWAYPSWFPLVLAMFFVVLGDFGHRARHARLADLPVRLPLWIVNSCLVYTTAVGGASSLTSASPANDAAVEEVAAEAPAATKPEPAPALEVAPTSPLPIPMPTPTPAAPIEPPEAPVAAPSIEPAAEAPAPEAEAPAKATTPRIRRPVVRAPRPTTTDVRPASTGFGRIADEPLF